MIHYLAEQDVLELHDALVEMFSRDDPIDPPGVRSHDLLSSALSRPQTGIGDIDKYNTIEKKAAALFHSLTMNHPFHNGNKRTALVSLITFLDWNNRIFVSGVDDAEIFRFVVDVAAGQFTSIDDRDADFLVDEIAMWIKTRVQAKNISVGDMRTTDFLDRIVEANGRWRESGSSFLVWGPDGNSGRSIRIAQATNSLNGNVVRAYLRKLGLSEGVCGISLREFLDGLPQEQDILRQYRNVLRDLAYA